MTSQQLADFYIALANVSGDVLTNLKLQKLIYYTQAWHIAFTKKPIFDENFEAWVHGPVLPSLYQEYKSFKWEPIKKDIGEKKIDEVDAIMDDKLKEVIKDVILKYYFYLSAFELEASTHNEDPWKNARKGLAIDENSHNPISKDEMRSYYEKYIVVN